jgi:hypothetical protein
MMSDYYNRKVAVEGIGAMLNGTTKAYIVIRYADVLLIRAEAAYYIGNEAEARARVNEVRQRARTSTFCKGYNFGSLDFPAPAQTPNLPDVTSSGQQLLEDVWQERRLELAGENFRTYDLIRTGRLLDRVGKVKDDDRVNNQPGDEARIPNIRQNIINSSIHVTVPGQGGGERYIPVFPIPTTEVSYWNLEPNPNN